MDLFWRALIITISVAFFQWFILNLVGTMLVKVANLIQLPLFNRKKYNANVIKSVVTLFALITLGLGTAEVICFSPLKEVWGENQGLQTGLLILFLLLPWINLALPFKKTFNFPSILAFHVSTVKTLSWMIALANPYYLIFPDENDFYLSSTVLFFKKLAIILLGIYYLISLGWLIVAEQKSQKRRKKL